MKDIAIIGGGPAGCRLAMLLSKKHDVAVIEEHAAIGAPVQCAGLVSPRTIDDVTRKSVVKEVRDFTLHSPGGASIELHAKEPRGVVVDRMVFDSSIALAAADKGAEILLSSRAINVKPGEDHASILYRMDEHQHELKARIVIGADGPKSLVRKEVTFEQFPILYRGAQVEGKGESGEDDAVEMWVGNKVAPGFFAWKIPVRGGSRLGLCTLSDDPPMRLLTDFMKKSFPKFRIISKHSGLIPVGPTGALYSSRLALLGDAAGQTKPLTGGGVFLGKNAAEILAKAILENGLGPKSLKAYEKAYRDRFDSEISRAWLIRKVINRMPDKKLDRAIAMLSDRSIVEIFERSGDIDAPAGLSRRILRRAPRLVQFAPEFLKSLL